MSLPPEFEEQPQLILESISDAFFALDDRLIVTYFNQAAERMLNRKRVEVLGKPLFDVFPEARASIFEEKYRYAIQHKQSLSFETYFDQPPYENWYQVRVYPRTNGISVYFQVITEQFRAKQALQKAQERMETILQTLSEGIVMVNRAGEVVFSNPAAQEMFDHHQDQLLLPSCQDCRWSQVDTILTPLNADQIPLAVALNQNIIVKDFEQGLLKANGEVRWLSVTAIPLTDEQEGFAGAIASFRDITAQKEREKQIRFQADLLNNIGQAAIAVDYNGKILYANQFCEQLFGYPIENLLGTPILETFVPSSSIGNIDQIRTIVRRGDVWNGEITLKRKNGANFTAYCSVTPIEEKSEILGFLVIAFDITERKWAEETERQLRALSDALRDTASALNSTLNFREVLERILLNLGKVIPHESANIMLLDGERVEVLFHKGYVNEPTGQFLEGLRFNISEFPTLQKMYESGLPLVIPNTEKSTLWRGNPAMDWIKSYAGMPLFSRGQVIGFLNLDSAKADFFNEEVIFRLQALADQAALAVQNARLYEEVQNLSVTDPLTGIYNRRGLFQKCSEVIEHHQRSNLPIALIVFDLDNFKDFNDTYGHATGDQILSTVARRIYNRLRPTDVLGRYGGDEFVLLLSGITDTKIKPTLERLRQSISLEPITAGGETLFVTISMGASTNSTSGYDLTTLLRHADHALYRVKKSGRNRAMLYGDLPEYTPSPHKD
ncbi:MAG: diguanylate cyclase [Chloroflexota bacterium]